MAHRSPICSWYGVCIFNQVRLQGRVSGSQAWNGRRLVMEALCPVKASGITQHNLRKSSKNQGFETRRGVPKTQSSLLFSAPLYFASSCTLTSFSPVQKCLLRKVRDTAVDATVGSPTRKGSFLSGRNLTC